MASDRAATLPPFSGEGIHRIGPVHPALVAAVLGFGLAWAIVAWPLPGLAAPVAIGLLLAAIRQPMWMLLAFFTSLSIPIQRSVAGIPVNASDALLVLWCALWPFIMQRNGAKALSQWRLPVVVVLIAPFAAVTLVSQLGSINPPSSIKLVLRIFEWFVVLPLVLTSITANQQFRRLAGVLMMVVPCVFAIDGMFEYFNNGRTITGMLGISVPVPEGGQDQIRHTYDVSGRAGSSFGGAQGLAMYLVITIGFSIAHIMFPPRPWMRKLGLACLAVSIGGLAVAQSRGGLLGAVAMLIAFALVLRPAFKWALFFGVALALACGLTFLGLWPGWDGTIGGLVPGRPEAVLDRLIIWGVVLDVARENPFFGVGLGNFRDAFFAREPWLHVNLAYPSLHAHNTYLELLADTGLVGLSCYLGFLVLVAHRLVATWRADAGGVLTLAAIGSLAAYTVFAMVDMLLLQNMHMLLVVTLCLGLTGQRSTMVGVAAADRAQGGKR
jgi:putative inorganic carbon (HCO3(-)) transporter